MASTFRAPAGNNLEISELAADDSRKLARRQGRQPTEEPSAAQLLKLNPLDLGAKKETNDAVGTSGQHLFGTPVRDVINKVLGHDDENDNESVGEKTETG